MLANAGPQALSLLHGRLLDESLLLAVHVPHLGH
jgi:hypothetical protein